MSRLRKSIISICVAVCICFLSVCSFSIDSHAVGSAVYMLYPEPATGDTMGYIVVGIDMDGETEYVTFAWALSSENIDKDRYETVPMSISVGSNSLTFSFNSMSVDDIWTSGYIAYYNYQGKYRILKSYNIDKDSESTYKYTFSEGITVKSYFVNGMAEIKATSGYKTIGTIVWLGGVYGKDVVYNLTQLVTLNKLQRTSLDNIYNYLKVNIANYLSDMNGTLDWIYDISVSTNGYVVNIYDLLNGQIKSYLSYINTKLQSLIDLLKNQNSSDQKAVNEFTDSSKNQSSALNQATQDSQTEKVDADAAAGTIDSTLDFNAVNEYSGVLMVITHNTTVVTMLLIVMCVALISYVLFGKR